MIKIERKKIIWLHPHLSYWMGGSVYIFEVIKRLKDEYGYEVILLTGSYNRKIKEKFNKAGIFVKKISGFSTNNIIYWLFLPFFFKKELSFLKNEAKSTDLIISTMFPMNYLASKMGKPHIQICWEPYAFFYDKELVKSLSFWRQLFVKIMAALYKGYDFYGVINSNRLLSLNKSTAFWIKRIYNRQADGLTYIGVDTKFFKPTNNLKLQSLYRNKKIIYHTTDFTILKGTRYLIEAMPLILSKIKNVKLLIANTVDNQKEKEKIIERVKQLGIIREIEFIGFLPYESLPSYYSLAGVVAFTGDPKSKGGSQASLTVIEALSCGTPVVRSSGCDEEVIDGQSGYLVDSRNPKVLGEALIKILEDSKLAKKMGKLGRNKILSIYTWDKVSKAINDKISSLL